jgi:hypothetical protein
MLASLLRDRCNDLSHLKPFLSRFFFVSGQNTARSSRARTGPQDAANALSRASAQAQVSALPHAGNRFCTRAARDLLLREADDHPSVAMTPEERDLVAITPDVTALSFSNLFGGSSYNERPKSGKWGILCVNRDAQPYAPHSPGASGLVFINPDAVLLKVHAKPSSCSSI